MRIYTSIHMRINYTNRGVLFVLCCLAWVHHSNVRGGELFFILPKKSLLKHIILGMLYVYICICICIYIYISHHIPIIYNDVFPIFSYIGWLYHPIKSPSNHQSQCRHQHEIPSELAIFPVSNSENRLFFPWKSSFFPGDLAMFLHFSQLFPAHDGRAVGPWRQDGRGPRAALRGGGAAVVHGPGSAAAELRGAAEGEGPGQGLRVPQLRAWMLGKRWHR